MNDGSRLLDALMDSGEGGSSGRRRGGRRVDSMIAGRRKPSAEGDGDSSASKPRSRSTGSSGSRSRSTTAKSSSTRSSPGRGSTRASTKAADEGDAEEKKPTRARRTPTAKKSDAEAAEKKPPSRRQTTTTKVIEAPEPAAAEAEPEESVAEESAEPAAEIVAPVRRTRRTTRSTTTRTEDVPAGVEAQLLELRTLIEEQGTMLTELRAGLTAVAEATDRAGYRPRMGIFVDVPNVMYGVEAGSKPIHMGKLLDFLSNGRELVRATAYSPVSDDPREPMEQQKFVAPFVPYNYRITTKPLKRFADGSIKGNFDVEMALDMLQMADRLDILSIVSGDADFSRAVEAVQTRGVRVEVVAFAGSASIEMRALADRYIQLDGVLDEIT